MLSSRSVHKRILGRSSAGVRLHESVQIKHLVRRQSAAEALDSEHLFHQLKKRRHSRISFQVIALNDWAYEVTTDEFKSRKPTIRL